MKRVCFYSGLLLPVLLLISLTGCDFLGTSDGAFGVRFELEKTTYKTGETVKARFINGSRRPVYLVHPDSCRAVGIEQRVGEAWIERSHPFSCFTVITFTLIPAGEDIELSVSYAHLAERVESPAGSFRFIWSVALAEDYEETRPVTSATFQVVAE